MYLYDVEQFCDHGRYPSKKGRTAAALHLVSVTLHLNKGAFLLGYALNDAGGIHFADSRQKDC